jgi:hypothetical protein
LQPFTSKFFFHTISSQPSLLPSPCWRGTGFDRGYHAIQTSDGGYAIVGFKNTDPDSAKEEIYMVKTDKNGNF